MIIRRACFIFLMFLSTGAFTQNKDNHFREVSPIFDISPDNKNIVLSISTGENSALYILSLEEKKLTQLTDLKGYYTRPGYSPSGKQVVFLSKNLSAETSDLCSINLESKVVTRLTDGKIYITEAAYLPVGNEIIFCGAGVITNYSPLARKAPHDLDLYSIGSDGKNFKQLTDIHAYQFTGISPSQKGDRVLCKLVAKDLEGIYLISLSDTLKTKIEAINNPRPQIGESFYGTPSFSTDNKQISFIAPYQLYILNLTDNKCEEIWSTFGKEDQAMPLFSRFNNTNTKIFFSALSIVNRQYNKDAKYYVVDISTKEVTAIPIP